VYNYDRRMAARGPSYDDKFVSRGLSYDVQVDLKTAEKILDGKATLPDLARLTGFNKKPVGIWWYIIKDPSWKWVQDSAAHAVSGAESTLGHAWGREELEAVREGQKTHADVELPLVFVGERPKGWDPDWSNPPTGLMGNSYLNIKVWRTVDLVDVWYQNGRRRWTKLKARGTTVRL
jgi:hypothetical protein